MQDHERMEIGDVLEALYGDGAWEIAKALTDEQRAERERKLKQVAVVGNTISAGAGSAAIYSAYANRKSGGMPRDVARTAGPKLMRSKNRTLKRIGVAATRGARRLDAPNSKKAAVAAGLLGGTAVGLQGVNAGMDALSAKLLKEPKKPVSKAWDDTPVERKGKLVKVTVEAAPKVAEQAKPVLIEVGRKAKSRKGKEFTFTAEGKVSKAFDDKRQVYGWVSITEIDGEPVVDRQGDYVSIEEIEKAAHKYLADSRRGGDMHDKTRHVSDLIESFIVTPEKKAALGLPEDTPTGWWAGFQVHDEDTWRKVRNGERPMFSIHGTGRRVDAELVA